MSRIAGLVVRLFAMLAGYALAALAASAFLHLVAWPLLGGELGPPPWELAGGLALSLPVVGIFCAYSAFVPALVLIGLSEWFGWRSWLYHALAGGAAAFGALMLMWQAASVMHGIEMNLDGSGDRPLMAEPQLMLVAVAAGMVAGLVYWFVAGSRAGAWRRGAETDRAPIAPAP